MSKWKEAAKFFAGFAANQVLTHGAFIFSQSPPKLFGIVYTPQFNLFAVIFWAVALVLLVYFAWIRK